MDTRMRLGRVLKHAMIASLFVSTLAAIEPVHAAPTVVAELFSSQGCSSCPPADRLLSELAEDEAVLPLTLAVDYWDYLGWKDTLASAAHSDRQRAYANRRGDRSVYTPQIVVNGVEHVVGSREGEVNGAMDRADAFTARVDLTSNKMAVKATVDGALPDGAQMATVLFLRISRQETVEIARGENAGRTVTYTNVVRSIQPIGMWTGGKATFHMPKSELMKSEGDSCAVLIQLEHQDGPGAIVGANLLAWRE
ncbi:MAG: DUF1223 domain-containing protein [Roseibium sp.]|nr:DUF1223 domain-containing protein [Roseibium sp.]